MARQDYAQTMLQRRRWLLLGGTGLALVFLVLSLAKGQWTTAAIFAVLLAVNARGYLRR
jgi:hypothetical protein